MPHTPFVAGLAFTLLVMLPGTDPSGPGAAAIAGEDPVAAGADAITAEELASARAEALEIESALVTSLDEVRRTSVAVIVKRARRDAEGKQVGEPTLVGCGSGVVIREKSKYFVITNQHVVEGSDALDVVTIDGKTHAVEVQDAVPTYDIELLRFLENPTGVEAASVSGRAGEKMEAGQWVLATGTPFFLGLDGQPVSTLGVVSGKDRVLGGEFTYSAIQHDAEVNPGNSGGPLWNLSGELIGINGRIATRTRTRIGFSASGASFSIPIQQVERFLAALVDEDEDAAAGYLGLDCSTFTDKDGTPQGARIIRVRRASPVYGTRKAPSPNMIIRSFAAGGKTHKIRTADDLTNALVLYPSGTEVLVKFRGAGESRTQSWRGKLAGIPEKIKKP